MIEQFGKLYNGPAMVGIDFVDCMNVFNAKTDYYTKVFTIENLVTEGVKWANDIVSNRNGNILVWGDGSPSIMDFNTFINGIGDSFKAERDLYFSYSGEEVNHDDSIRISLWCAM